MDQQRDDLKSVRDRTVALLGIATVAASVAAGVSASDEARSPSGSEYAAAACVISLVGVTLYVSWPRTIRFTVAPTTLIAWGKERTSDTVARSHLARWLETDYDKNRRVINQLLVAFRVGIGLLALEIVLLLWNLWG
jgi:hypothetical protein